MDEPTVPIMSRTGKDGTGQTLIKLAERIAATAALFPSRKSAAEAAGVSPDQLARYMRGENEPGFLTICRLAEAAEVDVAWLASGDGAMKRGGNLEERAVKGTVLIPRYDLKVLADPNKRLNVETAIDHWAIPSGWIQQMATSGTDGLVLVSAVGDSMEPTIRATDVVFVDTWTEKLVGDAIYLLRQDDGLTMKRVQRLLGGTLRIRSDNPAYVEETLDARSASKLQVAGRVCGIAKLF